MAERIRMCHRCMRHEVNGTATSRVDNSTPLCTLCEQTEAFEDMLGVLMPKEDWAFTKMCKHYGVEAT
jgi:hypothetical protein